MLTLKRQFAAKYVEWFAQASERSERLLKLCNRKGTSQADKEALWDGHWYVKKEADRMAAGARDCGVLLHLGAQGIAYARQHFAKEIAA